MDECKPRLRGYAERFGLMPHVRLRSEAGAYTRPLFSSTGAVEDLITQETRHPTIDLSRANTLQGLTIVHFFSAQPEGCLCA